MKLFEPDLPIFKGNLHTHTTQSDGRLSPEEVMAFYRAHGYDFLALTDHWHVNAQEMYRGMLVIPGVELDALLPRDAQPPREAVHIVGIGVNPALLSKVARGDEPQAFIDAINENGGRAILCHPLWSMNTLETVSALRGVAAAEIFNTFSGTPWNADRADASAFLDIAASAGWVRPLVASDDAHRYDGEACQAFICLQARSLDLPGILDALDRGAFFASQGPRFHQITFEDGEIDVRCSPASHIVFSSNLIWTANRCRSGENMTHARYAVHPQAGERFVRCEIVDAFGRKAWSNPITIA